jgi:phosphopantothenoylcysteine decarboxylase
MATAQLLSSEPATSDAADAQPQRPRILLTTSGSVVAIKFDVLCHCITEWADFRAVATASSLHFINRASLPTGVTLYTDEDERSRWKRIGDEVLHIELRK